MQPRQEIYRARAQARGPALPGMPQVVAPEVDDSGAKLAARLDDFMRVAGPAMGRAYVAQQTARVDDALLEAQKEFDMRWAEYQQASQGKDALDAGQVSQQIFADVSKEALKNFDGSSHEVFEGMLERRLKERGLQAMQRGLRWQEEQRGEWEKSQLASQQDEFLRMAASHPEDVAAIAAEKQNLKDSIALKNPGRDLREVYNRIDEQAVVSMAEGLLLKGDTAGVRSLINSPLAKSGGAGGGFGNVAAQFESGPDGLLAVGYDGTGGTSYGKYQLSSKQGSFQEWLKTLEESGPQGAAAAREIRQAGNADTGSRKGAVPETYKRLAREMPELFERTQRESLRKNNYATAAKGLAAQAPGLMKMIEGDAALEEMLFSTAVQHGGAGAVNVIGRVWREGMSREELINAVYDTRGNYFSSSKPDVQRAVRNRFRDEKQVVLNYGKERSVLSPRQAEALLRRCDDLDRRNAAASAAGMDEKIRNFVSASQDGHVLDMPVERGEVDARYGERADEVWATLEGARNLALDMHSVKTMSPAEMATLAAAREPEPTSPHYVIEKENQVKLQRGIAAIQKTMAEDPAGYVASVDPAVQKARERFMAERTPESCQAWLAETRGSMNARDIGGKLLSNSDAAMFASMISQSPDPVTDTRKLAQCFGASFPQALKEISGSLAPTIMLAATGMKEEPGRLLIAAGRDKDFEKLSLECLTQRRTDRKSLTELVDSELEEINQSFLAGGNKDLPHAIREGVTNLALQYMIRDKSLSDKKAIAKAAQDIITDRYHFFKRGKTGICRIPRQGYDVDRINDGLKAFLDLPPASDIATVTIPGTDQQIMGEALQSHIRQNAYWVTDSDEQGVVLFLGGRAVANSEGKPYRLSWAEVENLGRATRMEQAHNMQTGGINQNWDGTAENF